MKRTTTAFAAFAVAMLFSAPASAAEDVIELAVSPAELTSEEGTKRVLKRIRAASNRACSSSAILPPRLIRECRRELRAELVTKINQRLNDKRFIELAVATGLLNEGQLG